MCKCLSFNGKKSANVTYFFYSDLKIISNGECDTHSHESCIEAHTNTTVLPNGEYANDAFTAHDEVCGNDGRTYQSIHHLQCHTRHDKCESRIARGTKRKRLDCWTECYFQVHSSVSIQLLKYITNTLSKFNHSRYARVIRLSLENSDKKCSRLVLKFLYGANLRDFHTWNFRKRFFFPTFLSLTFHKRELSREWYRVSRRCISETSRIVFRTGWPPLRFDTGRGAQATGVRYWRQVLRESGGPLVR